MKARRREKGKLSARSIILLSSIPHEKKSEKYPLVYEAHIEINEAIVSMARAVFYEEGRIVFSGEPTISLMLALIAGEYIQPRFVEGESIDQREERNIPLINVYQPKYKKMFVEEMEFLESIGYISFREKIDSYVFKELKPVAAVCIGGMEDVEDDLETILAKTQDLPIYTIGKNRWCGSTYC